MTSSKFLTENPNNLLNQYHPSSKIAPKKEDVNSQNVLTGSISIGVLKPGKCLGGHYRPQIRAVKTKGVPSQAELRLDLDFSNPDNLTMLHRLTRDGKVIRESTMGKRDKNSPLRAYRHSSYGVKVPLVVVP